MKRHFLTGLVIFLPAVFTIAIVAFLVNLFTDPFINSFEGLLNYYQIQGPLAKDATLLFVVRLLVLILIVLFIILIGFLTRTFFMYSFFSMTDRLIHRIPIVNRIYKTMQEVIHTLFSAQGTSFKQVVLVPYPHDKACSIGFIVADVAGTSNEPKIQNKLSVFVPGTPNPTFGFILMFPKEQVVFTPMKVEEAFKLLVSCGIMMPNQPENPDRSNA